jgi:3-oxoacyl-[acyl-carrier protein] reductase
MDLGLRGKKALMLASSTGIGRAAAEALAAEGAELVIVSSNVERCRETARHLSQTFGTKAVPIVADMFSPDSMRELYAKAADALGSIDILFLNHPGPALGLAKEIDMKVLEREFRMVVMSPIQLIACALPSMRSRRWGRIVASSGAGMITPLPNKVMDNTLRASIAGYCQSLANEVGSEGVTVNIVMPGTFITDRVHRSNEANAALWGITVDEVMRKRIEDIPARRFGEAKEYGAVVAFLCSDSASYVNGSIVRVDGSRINTVT